MQGWKFHDPDPLVKTWMFGFLLIPGNPCSVLDKICWYISTTNIKITEIVPFTEKTNVKNRTFLVSMDVMSLDSSFDSFANIFMVYIETKTLSKTVFRTTVWKCYIHDIFSLWDMSKPDIEAFIEQANLHHPLPTIKFTAETFDTETAFLDTVVYKGTRFKEKSILDAKTHFKQTETFLHTHFTSCHPPSVKKGFVKG